MLPELMHQCGVDDDITTHLQKGIEEQCRQLAELAGPQLTKAHHG